MANESFWWKNSNIESLTLSLYITALAADLRALMTILSEIFSQKASSDYHITDIVETKVDAPLK